MAIDPSIIDSLEQDRQGTSLMLGRQDLTPEEMGTLSRALYRAKSLQNFDIEGECLTDITAKPLLDSLKNLKNLRDVSLAGGLLTDNTAEDIADLLRACPSIKTLSISGNPKITGEGLSKILVAAAETGGLVDFAAFNCGMTPEMSPALLRTLLAYQPRNLTDFDFGLNAAACGEFEAAVVEIGDFCTMNGEIAHTICQNLTSQSEADWSIADISNAGGRMESIRSRVSDGRFNQLTQVMRRLPVCDLAIPTQDTLSKPNEHGFTSLDNPAFWEAFEETAAAMAKAATPITKSFLMETRNRDGEPVLCNGIRNGKLAAITQALAANGETLDIGDLRDGKENPVLAAVLDAQQVHYILQDDFWKAEAAEMKQVMSAIPEAQRNLIPNRHGLLAAADRQLRAEQRANAL